MILYEAFEGRQSMGEMSAWETWLTLTENADGLTCET